MAINVLIVDECDTCGQRLCEKLVEIGYSSACDGGYTNITIAKSGDEAVGQLTQTKGGQFDLIICPSVLFLGASIFEVLELIRDMGDRSRTILLFDDFADDRRRIYYLDGMCYMHASSLCTLGAAIKHLFGKLVP